MYTCSKSNVKYFVFVTTIIIFLFRNQHICACSVRKTIFLRTASPYESLTWIFSYAELEQFARALHFSTLQGILFKFGNSDVADNNISWKCNWTKFSPVIMMMIYNSIFIRDYNHFLLLKKPLYERWNFKWTSFLHFISFCALHLFVYCICTHTHRNRKPNSYNRLFYSSCPSTNVLM